MANEDSSITDDTNLGTQPLNWLESWLEGMGADHVVASLASGLIALIGVIIIAIIANWIAKKIILRVIDNIVNRTPWQWDNVLRDNRVFARLSHLAPAMVIKWLGGYSLGINETVQKLIDGAVLIYVIVIILLVVSAMLNSVQAMVARSKVGGDVPVKGFVQAMKIILFIIGSILVLSVIFGKSPVYFLSGIGALTAVMLLVFRDALLGLVAGVMISVNQMVRIGDWIEMPSNGADGDVIDVSLTTVKVQNWDRTITTIPSYDLISKSFKNWIGMEKSGGRRIKRAINIDMQTIRFIEEKAFERLKRVRRLRPYLEEKRQELAKENNQPDLDLEMLCNGRRLTNIGTFRAYCIAYLKEHPQIRKDMTFLVRQLAPTEHGLPLEIYVFSSDIRWAFYEGIQADIFDHLLSVVGEFGLRVYQEPSGYDIHDALKVLKPASDEGTRNA